MFPANAEQERIARARGISAPIVPGARFYLAEDYHQKYYLRHDSTLLKELAGYSPAQLVESTVAARLNGYAGGKPTVAQVHEELPRLGLSNAATQYVLRRFPPPSHP